MRVRLAFLAVSCFALLGCGEDSPSQRSPESPSQRPPKPFTIYEGDRVTYRPGVARIGDTIVCEASGGSVGAKVPRPGTGVGGAGTGPDGGATVTVAMNEDGSVVATCSF